MTIVTQKELGNSLAVVVWMCFVVLYCTVLYEYILADRTVGT